MLKNPQDVMEESNLHVTLRHKPAPGPDPSYRLMISKWSAQTVHVEYLCSEQTTQAAVESPCSATYFTQWKDSGQLVLEGQRAKDWQEVGKGVQESRDDQEVVSWGDKNHPYDTPDWQTEKVNDTLC